jgi:REP element-mobilizing transposase RayT
MPAIAYFITWSTYGTRLHGDPRGSVDEGHNRFGTPVLPAAPDREFKEMRRMRHPPMLLDALTRACVDEAVREHVAFRGWTLLALEVRSNHVHLVVRATIPPEEVMGKCKARASRVLRERGLVQSELPIWAEHGSTKHVFDDQGLRSVVDYVTRLQDLEARFERESQSKSPGRKPRVDGRDGC